jgi:regulatory protein YycI of two-component signal transduction system YycFG
MNFKQLSLLAEDTAEDDDILAGMEEADKAISHKREVMQKLEELKTAQIKLSNALYQFEDVLSSDEIINLYKTLANKETLSDEEEEFIAFCNYDNFIDMIIDYQRSFDYRTRILPEKL